MFLKQKKSRKASRQEDRYSGSPAVYTITIKRKKPKPHSSKSDSQENVQKVLKKNGAVLYRQVSLVTRYRDEGTKAKKKKKYS